MKRQPTLRGLTYSAAFEAFDGIANAETDFGGTFAVFSRLLDSCSPDDGNILTMERHMASDFERLKAAIDKARTAIIMPLHAGAYPNAPRAAGDAAEHPAKITLAVNNDGDDHAA